MPCGAGTGACWCCGPPSSRASPLTSSLPKHKGRRRGWKGQAMPACGSAAAWWPAASLCGQRAAAAESSGEPAAPTGWQQQTLWHPHSFLTQFPDGRCPLTSPSPANRVVAVSFNQQSRLHQHSMRCKETRRSSAGSSLSARQRRTGWMQQPGCDGVVCWHSISPAHTAWCQSTRPKLSDLGLGVISGAARPGLAARPTQTGSPLHPCIAHTRLPARLRAARTGARLPCARCH